jgi:FKBP-type peptidyl-prolyl cis-trans isomerase
MGALLFFVTASALTIAVVFDSLSNKKPDTTATDPTQRQTDCSINQVAGVAEKLPANYEAKAADVSELKITDLSQGTGPAAKAGDCLQMKYYGTLAKDGKMFDQNYDQASALQFALGKGQVIPGWDTGIVGMKVGGVRRLVIPSALAYGEAGQGSIPANATLVFLVKLVAIK